MRAQFWQKTTQNTIRKKQCCIFSLTLYVRLFYSLCARFSVFDAEGPFDVGRFCVCQNFPHFARFFLFPFCLCAFDSYYLFALFLLFSSFLLLWISIVVFVSSFSRHHFLFRNFNFFICKDADIRFCTRRARKGMGDENGRCPAHRLGKRFQAVSFLESFVLW